MVAPIGTGKSSLQAGLKHIFELEIQDKIIDKLEQTKILLPQLDFNAINEFIDENIRSYNDFAKLTNNLIKQLDINDSFIFDIVNFYQVYSLFYDYIYAYYCLNYRNNYVMSKTKIFSRVTNNYNLSYLVDNQKINEAYINQSYDIEDYVVELLDELTDEFGAGKYFNDIKDENGAKDYRRKYRHIHKENNRIISTKQDASDEIKKYRILNNTEVEILQKVKLIGRFLFIQKIFLFLLSFVSFFRNLIIFFKWLFRKKIRKNYSLSDYNDFLYNQKNLYKTLKSKVHFLFKTLDSFGFCYFKTKVFLSNKDIESSSNYYKVNFYIPMTYCFGVYDTFEFNYIQLNLLSKSRSYAVEILRYEEEHIDIIKDKGKKYESATF